MDGGSRVPRLTIRPAHQKGRLEPQLFDIVVLHQCLVMSRLIELVQLLLQQGSERLGRSCSFWYAVHASGQRIRSTRCAPVAAPYPSPALLAR